MNTHEVFNQATDLTPYDVSDDASLLDGLDRAGGGWAREE